MPSSPGQSADKFPSIKFQPPSSPIYKYENSDGDKKKQTLFNENEEQLNFVGLSNNEVHTWEDDEPTDFSKLLGFQRGHHPSLPRRGLKSFGGPDGSEEQIKKLKESREALRTVISEERKAVSRNLCKATYYSRPIHQSHLTQIRRQDFHQNMGHNINGETWLWPEETLWLMERGVLVVEFNEVPISMQQAYEIMLGNDYNENDDDDDGDNEWVLTLEKYQIYAYLKRLGYTVIRPPPKSAHSKSDLPISPTTSSQTGSLLQQQPQSSSIWLRGIQQLGILISPNLQLISSWFRHDNKLKDSDSPSDNIFQPLVSPRSCSSYKEVFKRLQIIQRSSVCPIYHQYDNPDEKKGSEYVIDFFVYAGGRKFKKKQPGEPSFRVVVTSGETQTPPTLSTLNAIFQESEINTVMFAIVKEANIMFVSFADILFQDLDVKIVGDGY
ncbi:hypothetical protein G9A89_009648 [Geosiphon pyriformis]|nr:hypothetical protein G9A89_009648 [Geosiphon pyriformis]